MAAMLLPQEDGIGAPERALLNGIGRKLGFVPALLRAMARSPGILQGYVAMRESMTRTSLPLDLREKLAIAVAAENNCRGCLAAHLHFAEKAGVDAAARETAQQWESAEPSHAAALRLGRAVLAKGGHLDQAELDQAREAGLDDIAMMEVAAVVGMNSMTNMISSLASLPPDLVQGRAPRLP